MATETAISLALLQVNWDQRRKDYLDNFVPIVAECLRLQEPDVVSISALKLEIEKHFGLNIPASPLETILRRLRRHGYVCVTDGVYHRDRKALSSLNYHKIQQAVVLMHDSLIADMISYCKQQYGLDWSTDEASNNLLSCLKQNGLEIASAFTQGTLIPDTVLSTPSGKYHCALYINHLQHTMSGSLDHLRKLVEGHMLANAIFLPDPMRASMNFRNTRVFFDTSFLIFALGYAGRPRQEPCTELLQLLYETGAELCCFPHTLTEIKGILHACSHRLQQGQQTDAFGTIEYFIERNYTDSDIQVLINAIATTLQSLRVVVTDKPPYEPKYVIDEAAFEEALQAEINYSNSNARARDVDSVSAIMRLRHMNHYPLIEDCKAIFITTNTRLARVSRLFFYDAADQTVVAPCITDYSLTNLLWLKRPLELPDLPMKRVIADCYAALQPDERLMRAYLAKIDQLERQGDATEDDVFMLRYSLEARQALMDVTSGDEQLLTNFTIAELLDIVKATMQSKLRAELEAEAQQKVHEIAGDRDKFKSLAADRASKLERAQLTIGTLTASDAARKARIQARAYRLSLAIARSLGAVFILALAVGIFYTSPWHQPQSLDPPLRHVVFACFIALALLTVTNLIGGFHVRFIIRRLALKLEALLHRLINGLTS